MTTTVVESPEPPIDSGDNIVVVAPAADAGETHCEHCVNHEGRIAVLETRLPAVEEVAADAAATAEVAAIVADNAASEAAETPEVVAPVSKDETPDEDDEVNPGKHTWFKSRDELFA